MLRSIKSSQNQIINAICSLYNKWGWDEDGPLDTHYKRSRPPFNNNFSRNPSRKRPGELEQRVCKYWMVNGECPYGDCCKFLHSWYRTSSTSGDGCFFMLARLDGHKKVVCGIALPTWSDKLFNWSRDGTVRIWDCHSGKCNRVINLGAEVGCLSSEGTWVFIGLPNLVKVWNLNREIINDFSLEGPVGQVYALAVHNDLLFAGAANGDILVWKGCFEANPFKLVATIKAHKQAVVCLRVDAGAYRLYSGSMDNTVNALDLETFQCKQTMKGHNGVVMSLFTWQHFLLTCSLDQTMKVWAMKDGGYLELVHTHEEKHGILDVFGMQDAQGKPVLFCSCNDNCVRLYELDSFAERGRILAKKEVREIQIGPGGLFFTGDAIGMVTVWNWLAERSQEAS
ncbi:unnamed protein product [Dovyalis caffra]|uniref:C3H1-type domain-containing protein n=1 Tax=Dovyalis caffra TaxID=77055 RepID=A0AAV1RIM0_9ROSI|nr:unnamed protein product [Dovyalis caffra]